MAALVADDVVEAVGEQIDQLALAFVAPLRAQNDNIAHLSEELLCPSQAAYRPNGAIVTHCVTLAFYAAFRRVSATRRGASATTVARHFDRKTEDLSALRTLQDAHASAPKSIPRICAKRRPRFWARLKEQDEEFATDLSQADSDFAPGHDRGGAEFSGHAATKRASSPRISTPSRTSPRAGRRACYEHFKDEYPEAAAAVLHQSSGLGVGSAQQACSARGR